MLDQIKVCGICSEDHATCNYPSLQGDGPRNRSNNSLYPWLPTFVFQPEVRTNLRGVMHRMFNMHVLV
jgi:hypothetical protein